MNRKLFAAIIFFAVLFPCAARSQEGPDDMRQAVVLYENGMYSQARTLFDGLGADPIARAYSIMCSQKMKSEGYKSLAGEYAMQYPWSAMKSRVFLQGALSEFEDADYESALRDFGSIPEGSLREDEVAEYTFKKGYSLFSTGDYDSAAKVLRSMDSIKPGDYTMPAKYTLGYILYTGRDFKEAFNCFRETANDPRFADQSKYYMLECRFMDKDYKYVTDNAEAMYAAVPEDRRPHLARIISESYLVRGNAAKAREYYDKNLKSGDTPKTRTDWFYSGSVLYAVHDWKGAIDSYNNVKDRTDSLGQIASYNLAGAYLETKNKVAALGAFKEAAALSFDKGIQEDAWFNWGKLAFDLNHDPKPFESYMAKYKDLDKNDLIYSYIALASLYNHDYAGAVEAYDKIDELDDDMKSNYMKANYLRANQLISQGSWRDAVPCLRAAAYYSDKRSTFNQLSRYWLAESYYRDGKYEDARTLFTDLYNNSALDGKPEAESIPLSIAYCNFEEGNWDAAVKWFGNYLEGGSQAHAKEAAVRMADCDFIQARYPAAITGYQKVLDSYKYDANDIYPYYQQGIAYGLNGRKDKKIEALSRVKQASVTAPLWSEAMYELGRAYVDAGKTADARDCFNSLRTYSRDTTFIAGSLIELGMVARNASRYDEALGYYKQVVKDMPGTDFSNNAMLAIESIYTSQGRTDDYLAYVESLGGGATKSDAEKESLYFSSAEQIFMNGNYQKALVALQTYQSRYPSGEKNSQADFYIAECYRLTGQKEQACDYYSRVMKTGAKGSTAELAALHYGDLSYGLEHWAEAYDGYRFLRDNAVIAENKTAAAVGMMRSAYSAKDFREAISCANSVSALSGAGDALKREADYIKAKSYLGNSDRDNAFAILEKLSAKPSTDEGAEATWLIIQDLYDRGEFDKVEDRVYKFASAAPNQSYWLAKSYITLGDTFAETDKYKQAKATFESIRDGYRGDDDVLDNVNMRLARLAKITEE
ncbi:MAG: tetratricopeptide repeat protein [Bacteroidales bacterium]|nr:tetratricopeptide repeat protein [Bacteroidales bacterium]